MKHLPRLYAACLLFFCTLATVSGEIVINPPATASTATRPAPAHASIDVAQGGRGNIAILQDAQLLESLMHIATSAYAEFLRSAGYGVTALGLGDLMNGKVFNARNFDLLLLPDGRYYPADGRDVLVKFLQAGGAFLSLSGYAFDRPVVYTERGWQVAQGRPLQQNEHARERLLRINTRFGNPSDIMWTAEDQIGVFDPSYPLTDVAEVRLADDQGVLPGRGVSVRRSYTGWAATAMTGNNQPVFPKVYARRIPLLAAYDRFGRPRGAVALIVHHYDGPFAGSSWGVVGVEDANIFDDLPNGSDLLVSMIEALIRPVYLHEIATDWPCYDAGEPVVARVNVTNGGDAPDKLTVRFSHDGADAHSEQIQLAPGETRTVSATIGTAADDHGDVHLVTVAIDDGQGRTDAMDTGYVVRHEATLTGGPTITYQDNYFQIDERPTFLSGTNQTGMMWFSATENPLGWRRDFERMRRHGMRVLRILHFSPFADKGYEGRAHTEVMKLAESPPERLVRQTDAIVQVAQKQGVILFLTLHDWMNVDLTDEELDAQRKWAEFWVGRYRDVPGILFDIQNEPWIRPNDRPESTRLFNDFLKDKYGDIEAIREAWTVSPPKHPLGEIEFRRDTARWDDVRSYDANLAGIVMVNRWIEANARGIRAGDPNVPFTVGYLADMSPADHALCVKHQTFNNMHYYGPLERMPLQLKMSDRRFEGKSFSLGEFGSQEAHNARTAGQSGRHDDVSIERYLHTTHYAFGMGGSMALTWVLKDFEDCIFPWGLSHSHDDLPKPLMRAYRNMSVMLERFEPVYREPEVYLVLPDTHRLGGDFNPTHDAIRRSIAMLLACHVEFNVINEFDLDRLPASAKVLFLPVPYCLHDDAFARLDAFVRDGGHLYVSGDLAYDEARQRTRVDRWNTWGFDDPGATEPMKIDPASEAELQRRDVGKGQVSFSPLPVECRSRRDDLELYRQVLRAGGAPIIPILPEETPIHVFDRPTVHDGHVYVMVNPQADGTERIELDTAAGTMAMSLQPKAVALVWIDGQQRIRALEAQGQVLVDKEMLWEADGMTGILAVDDQDIRQSRQLLIFPYEAGDVSMSSTTPEALTHASMLYAEARIREKQPVRADGAVTLSIAPDEVHAWWLLTSQNKLSAMEKDVLAWIALQD